MAESQHPTTESTPPTNNPVDQALEEYAMAVGKVVRAWNHLQERLGQLFCIILEGNYSVTSAVWYSSNSDRTQQNMLRAAIEGLPPNHWPELPRAREDLIWLVKKTMELADSRNNAIHIPVAIFIGGARGAELSHSTGGTRSLLEVGAVPYRGNLRARRSVGKNLLNEFAWCERCAVVLGRFSQDIELALRGVPFPWPDRPHMPSRGQKKEPTRPPSPSRTKQRVRHRRSSTNT